MRLPRILRIIRVHIVLGGVLAFFLGSLLAIAEGGSFDVTKFVLCYAVVLLGDLSTHYSNDFFDVDVDKYSEQRKFFAGSKVLVHNPNLQPLARSISVSLLLLSNALAICLVLFLAIPFEFFIIFLGASLAGWFYSAPPLRLVSRGLGEIIIACVTGFAIPALGYLALRGQFDPLFLCFAVPFTMYGLILSLSLAASDIEIDRKGLKRTIAVRKGARSVFSLILILAAASTVAFLFYGQLLPSSTINVGLVALFSVVPLLAGLIAFAGISQKQPVNRLSALNIAALFVFNALMIGYLLVIALVTL